jgi:tetratricopeptide (TPR) repeat protein
VPVSKRRKPKKGRRTGPKVHGGSRLVTPRSAASPPDPPGLPADMRAMERVTASIVPGRTGKRGKEPDLQDAQDLIYDAWETLDPRERVRLAREALLRSSDCADAYVILAEEVPATLEEKRDMYIAGVEAGERAIGERAFKEDIGRFWGLLETRPYMRARAGLAACLWKLGKRDQAVAHYRAMLRLNPGDNQGIRYTLLGCLLAMRSDDRAAELLDDPEYADDASATWPYSRALLAYRRAGPSEQAETLLSEARRTNPHVPAYLLGQKRLPKELPHMIGFGDESEAIAYAADNLEAWRSTPSALEWLAEAGV